MFEVIHILLLSLLINRGDWKYFRNHKQGLIIKIFRGLLSFLQFTGSFFEKAMSYAYFMIDHNDFVLK